MDGRPQPSCVGTGGRLSGRVRPPHTRRSLRATRASVRASPRLPTSSRSAIRHSLRVSIAEGLVAELVAACAGGGVLTAWALYLGLSPVLVGVLGALPFAAQFVQIPSAWLTRVHGSRRTAVVAIGLSRQLPLLLAAVPWMGLPVDAQRAALLAVAGTSSLLSVVGNNA